MSEFLTTIMFLSPLVLILFFLLQSKIGKEQEEDQYKKFAEENPHLAEYLKRSPKYQDYYSKCPQMEKVSHSGGMTEEQKEKLLEEMWVRHNTRLKEIHGSKEKPIVESVTTSSKSVRSKRKP